MSDLLPKVTHLHFTFTFDEMVIVERSISLEACAIHSGIMYSDFIPAIYIQGRKNSGKGTLNVLQKETMQKLLLNLFNNDNLNSDNLNSVHDSPPIFKAIYAYYTAFECNIPFNTKLICVHNYSKQKKGILAAEKMQINQ